VSGVSVLALGGVALGAGLLGLAFWAGRRSASHREAPRPEPVATASPTPASRPADSALNTALTALINAAVQSGVKALTKRLEQA